MTEPRRRIKEPAPAREAPEVIYLPPPRPRRKGGGRRPTADPATAIIKLRTTPAKKAEIRAEAKRAGQTLTAYLLRNASGRTGRAAKPAAIADPLILTKLLSEVGHLGGNHNQLAHAYNATGETPGRKIWESQDRAIQEMKNALLKALGYVHD
jgi:hypothetical protein